MSGKQKLIDSMSNLIHHVSLSRGKQQEIFGTLSAEDLKKMLCNLQDENQNVRKMTLILLAQFLNGNQWTQSRFCELTETAEFQGKLVFSSKFPKPILTDKVALREVFEILKFNVKEEVTGSCQTRNGLFWYIDSRAKTKNIEVGVRNKFSVDPLHCIVGVWMTDKNKTGKIKQTFNATDSMTVQQKTSVKSKIKLSSSAHHQKDSSVLLIPETPTKSTLTQQPIAPKGQSYTQEQFMTPIRTKPNVNFLAKTEPIGMGSNFQFPVSYFQTPPLVKPPNSNTSIYVNFNPNSTISYTSYGSPVMPNRGVVEKNHAGFVYEERRPYGYGQSNNGDSYRQGYRGM